MTLSKSFAEGKGFLDPASPVPNTGMLRIPTAFPILLSAYWHTLHPHLAWLKVFNAALLSCGILLVFAWLNRYLDLLPAFCLSLAMAASTLFITITNSIMTEVLFVPLLYAGMLLSNRHEESDSRAKGKIFSALALLCWLVLARTRVIGILFFLAFLFVKAWKQRWGSVLCGILLLGLWMMWESGLGEHLSASQYTDGLFNRKFPVLVDPLLGLLRIWENFSHNFWSYAGSMHAKALFPYLYDLVEMNRFKRLVVLAVFAWSLVGCALIWKHQAELRPWILAGLLSLVPTFLFFIPTDIYRYMFPYFPFLLLTLVYPFTLMERSGALRRAPLFILLISLSLLINQATHSPNAYLYLYRQEQGNFLEVHRHIQTLTKPPRALLTPDRYYSHLKTSLPAMSLHQTWELPLLREVQTEGEILAICGGDGHNSCDQLVKYGVNPEYPPLYTAGTWLLYRIAPTP